MGWRRRRGGGIRSRRGDGDGRGSAVARRRGGVARRARVRRGRAVVIRLRGAHETALGPGRPEVGE